eukprot:Pgem_evm1s18090
MHQESVQVICDGIGCQNEQHSHVLRDASSDQLLSDLDSNSAGDFVNICYKNENLISNDSEN